MNNSTPEKTTSKSWPIFQSFAGWRWRDLGADAIAGLTLAAIAIPEQMATARLGGFTPQLGFLAIMAGALGFAAFGSNRFMSVGADTTITPIFAGSLALLAVAGSPHFLTSAVLLAFMVGLLLLCGGLFRLGFIANLLSAPVTTGFLAGISGHILVSQVPALFGVLAPSGSMIQKLIALAGELRATNYLTLLIGFGVLVVILICERISQRIPGALIGLGGATVLVATLGLESKGVSALGMVAGVVPSLSIPEASIVDLVQIAPLAVIVALVIMVQTAATSRSFPSDLNRTPDVNRDFLGVGAANVLSGLMGVFPVNASPPRTAVVAETGGVSQLGALVCAVLVLILASFGSALLTHVPHAALAGVLLFVAQRIFRLSVMVDVFRRSLAEFGLIIATTFGILILPIQEGVAMGIILSLLHGLWTTTRARMIVLQRMPGSSIWWPINAAQPGETVVGVEVIAVQAPLTFLNIYDFQAALQNLIARTTNTRVVVIESNAIVEIDYTAAQVLSSVIRRLRAQGVDVAFARLESVHAQQSFQRLGLAELVGADHVFRSVEGAVLALGPQALPR